MTKNDFEQIFSSLADAVPELELAIFDSKGHLLLSRPTPLIHKLPSQVAKTFSTSSDNGRFTAALPIRKDAVLAFTQKVSGLKEAEDLTALAQNIIDLNCHITSLQYSLNARQDETLLFLNRLFNVVTEDDAAYVTLSALRFGYQLNLERAICAFDIHIDDSDQKLHETIFSSIIKFIRSTSTFSDQDILACFNERQIVYCLCLKPGESPLRQRCYTYLSELYIHLMEQFNITLRIGVGSPPTSVQEYGQAFLSAQNALRFSQIFRSNRAINFDEDFILESEISELPTEVTEHFFGQAAHMLRQAPQWFETLDALVKNNMDINAAASYLYVHRNTVVFRLNQIKKKLGLNPFRSDSDRFALIALYIYMMLHEEDERIDPGSSSMDGVSL